jgi:hypothetical protein
MADERTSAGRPNTGEGVEDRFLRPRFPALAVEAEREAVRLVANALEQLQLGGVVRQPPRLRAARRIEAAAKPSQAARST